MKRIILKYFILILLILLQTSNLLNTLKIGNIKPDFVLKFIVYISLTETFMFSETMAFFAGLLIDIMTYSILGINSFVFTILAVLLNQFKTQIFVEKSFSVFFVAFISSLVFRLLYYFLTIIFFVKMNLFKTLLKISLPEAFYTAIVAIVIFPLYHYMLYRR